MMREQDGGWQLVITPRSLAHRLYVLENSLHLIGTCSIVQVDEGCRENCSRRIGCPGGYFE